MKLHVSTEAGFTLIELVAVVATFALIAAMVLPNLDLGGSRAVNAAAADLATALELARERAIMTGRVHAVVIDLDRGAHWIEWSKPLAPETPAPAAEAGKRQLDLVPPPIEGEALEPLFGVFGKPQVVEDPVVILGVEIDDGVVDSGTVELRMDADGATEPAAILLGDADGKHVMRVPIEPLSDWWFRTVSSSARRGVSGFTLLEVLAAVALLAIAYSQLGSSGIQGLQHEGEARRRIAASLLADSTLAEIESAIEAGTAPQVGEEETEQEDFTISVLVEPFSVEVPEEEGSDGNRIGRARSRLGGDAAAPAPVAGPSLLGAGAGPGGAPSPLRRIEVRVAWEEGFGERSATRVTYALDPEAASGTLESLAQSAAQSQQSVTDEANVDASPGESPLEEGRQ